MKQLLSSLRALWARLRALWSVRTLELLTQWCLFGVSTVFSAKLWLSLAGDNPIERVCYVAVASAVQAGAITFWILGALERGWRRTWAKRILALVCVAFSLLGPAIERVALLTETTTKVEAAGFRGASLQKALEDAREELASKKTYGTSLAERLAAQPIDQSTKAMRDEIAKNDSKIAELRTRIEGIENDLEYELGRTATLTSASVQAVDRVAAALGIPSNLFSVFLLLTMAVLSEVVMLALAWFVYAPAKRPKGLMARRKFVQLGQAIHGVGKDGKTLCGCAVPAAAKPTTEPTGFMCAKCLAASLEGV